MNVVLAIVIIMLQDDGSVTRQHEEVRFKTMDECRAEMRAHADAIKSSGAPVLGAQIQCYELGTLEVIKPAPGRKA